MRTYNVTTNGIQLCVRELGAGSPVLFVHGFPSIGTIWREQMEAVAQAGFRAIAPDMRGYGGSDSPEDAAAYMPFFTVGDLVGILDELKLESCVIVGHDFGANIAWNAAMMRPDRFHAVFGVSVPFLPLGGPGLLDQMRQAGKSDFYMFAQILPEADQVWANAAVTIPSFYYRSSGEASAREQWNAFDAAGMTQPSPAAKTISAQYLRDVVQSFQQRGFHGSLNYYRALDSFFAIASGVYAGATIKQAAWFLTGAKDGLRAFQPDEETMSRLVPGLRGYTVLDEVGHWPQLEAAADVNQHLLAFLNGLDARQPG